MALHCRSRRGPGSPLGKPPAGVGGGLGPQRVLGRPAARLRGQGRPGTGQRPALTGCGRVRGSSRRRIGAGSGRGPLRALPCWVTVRQLSRGPAPLGRPRRFAAA
eukprot:14963815-Alexandrium_andersonii.AAC.1